MLLVHLFVCFACVSFCLLFFSLPLGVDGCLDLSINLLTLLPMKYHQNREYVLSFQILYVCKCRMQFSYSTVINKTEMFE